MPVSAETIHRHIATMDGKLATIPTNKRQTVKSNAELDMAEWATMGPFASEMMLFNLVDLDAANLLHRIHTEYNGTATLAERLVFLQIMGEYMEQRGRQVAAHSA